MKKFSLILISVFLFALGACEDEVVNPVVDDPQLEDLSVQEILQKSSDAYNDLLSIVAHVEASQSIQEQSIDIVNEMELNSEFKLLLDPTDAHDVVGIHELTKTIQRTLYEHGNEEIDEYTLEQYKSPEGLFRKYPDEDGWSKLQDREYDGISDSLRSMKNPRLDVSIFEQYADDFTLNENNEVYRLNLSSTDEKMKRLILEILLRHGRTEESITANEQQLASMKIDTFEVELSIDKETFHTIAFQINLDIEIEIIYEDYHQVQHIIEKVKVDISSINELESIQVPQEVIDTAVDVDW